MTSSYPVADCINSGSLGNENLFPATRSSCLAFGVSYLSDDAGRDLGQNPHIPSLCVQGAD